MFEAVVQVTANAWTRWRSARCERLVLEQGGLAADVYDGGRQFRATAVCQPYRFARPKRNRLVASLINGDVVGVQPGSVRRIAYRV